MQLQLVSSNALKNLCDVSLQELSQMQLQQDMVYTSNSLTACFIAGVITNAIATAKVFFPQFRTGKFHCRSYHKCNCNLKKTSYRMLILLKLQNLKSLILRKSVFCVKQWSICANFCKPALQLHFVITKDETSLSLLLDYVIRRVKEHTSRCIASLLLYNLYCKQVMDCEASQYKTY